MDQRNQVGEFLRSRRDKLMPERAGIIGGGRRRVPGLRHEEVVTQAMDERRAIKVPHPHRPVTHRLAALREHVDIVPAVNQIEAHPYFTQTAVVAA